MFLRHAENPGRHAGRHINNALPTVQRTPASTFTMRLELSYLLSFAALLAPTTDAAPQPKPAGHVLKQTTRNEILLRRSQPPRRRSSGMTYPECGFGSNDVDAAVYNTYRVSPLPDSFLGNPFNEFGNPVACFQQCLATDSIYSLSIPLGRTKLTLPSIGCRSGYFERSDFGGGLCYLFSDSTPTITEARFSTAFIIGVTCGDYAYNGESIHTDIQRRQARLTVCSPRKFGVLQCSWLRAPVSIALWSLRRSALFMDYISWA